MMFTLRLNVKEVLQRIKRIFQFRCAWGKIYAQLQEQALGWKDSIVRHTE